MKTQMAAVLLGCALAPVAFGGAVLEMTDRDLRSGKVTGGQTYFAQGGKVRIDHGGPERNGDYALFRDQTLFNVNSKSKTYTKMDSEALAAMGNRMKSAMSQMQAQMANMPPEQRAQIEKMMGKQMGGAAPAAKPKRTLTNTGKTEKTAGYTCTVWNETVDGVLDTQLCVVPPGALKGGDELFAALKEFGKFMREFADAMPHGQRDSNNSDYERINGIPVITRDIEGGKPVRETRVTASRTESLGAAVFELPKGYTQKKMPGLGMN